tara:strand:+ start:3502 stop:3822 length:321 start_codon:yes stop_codon:yes gene_type:complete
MGYRSKVYIGMPICKTKKLESLNFEGDDNFMELFDKIKSDGDVHIYLGIDLKWYDEWRDVQRVTDIIQECEDDGAFQICIGEDEALHSAYGNYYEYIDIRTTIDIL